MIQNKTTIKKKLVAAEQLKDNFVTVQLHGAGAEPGQTFSWCKTFDRNASFAGLNRLRWLRPFREASDPSTISTSTNNPTTKNRIMLVEHPLLRLARFYRDGLRDAAPDSPLFVLSREIRSRSGDAIDLQRAPTFEQFLRFALSDRNRWNPYGAYWQPYSVVCEPCLLQYTAVLKLEPDWLGFGAAEQSAREWQQEAAQLRGMYQMVGEKLMEQLMDYYRDDLTVLVYQADRFYQEVYRNWEIEIVQVRP
ncbi:uncharacterized protein LOC128732387 [Sabethes cyaneus]|uniref:uncharacterized protein LOC128732387 n=1 Tax=Sabethes cyaneus TaxID=53552 RepID=UPI00237D61EA|nr:uncharacterized protein LOC128732387 [Sabethes cyaneus]